MYRYNNNIINKSTIFILSVVTTLHPSIRHPDFTIMSATNVDDDEETPEIAKRLLKITQFDSSDKKATLNILVELLVLAEEASSDPANPKR